MRSEQPLLFPHALGFLPRQQTGTSPHAVFFHLNRQAASIKSHEDIPEREETRVEFSKMTQVEHEESAQVDDGGMTGPGAPTPLSALEVRVASPFSGSLANHDSFVATI